MPNQSRKTTVSCKGHHVFEDTTVYLSQPVQYLPSEDIYSCNYYFLLFFSECIKQIFQDHRVWTISDGLLSLKHCLLGKHYLPRQGKVNKANELFVLGWWCDAKGKTKQTTTP